MRTFTEKTISGLIRKTDAQKYRVDIRNARQQIICDVISTASSGVINFRNNTHRATINGKACMSIKDYTNVLIARTLSLYLSQRFKLKAPNRNNIILGILETLSDSSPMIIIKRDIKSFYENINTGDIEKIIFKNTSLPMPPLKIKILLRAFFRDLCNNIIGIPRGVGLSAALSEIALLDFDARAKKIDGVYRYFRYVDDILIFLSDKTIIDAVNEKLNNILPEHFAFNNEKSIPPVVLGSGNNQQSEKTFNYLGYGFKLQDGGKNEKPRKVTVSIAEEKIIKLKTKIILAIKCFGKDNDQNLLLERMRFISSNYRVLQESSSSPGKKRKINAGIFFNYRLCGEYSGKDFALPEHTQSKMTQLIELDSFYQAVIGNKSKFNHILSRISPENRRALRAISFKVGYEKVIIRRFDKNMRVKIMEAWRYA